MARKFFRKFKKSFKRKISRRNSKNYKTFNKAARMPRALVYAGKEAIPDVYRCKMQWSDIFRTSQLNSMGFQWKAFRGNSPRDPEAIQGPNQHAAVYFNELARIYRKYRVYGAKVKIESASDSTGAGLMVLCPFNGDYPNLGINSTPPEWVSQWPNAVSRLFDGESKLGVLKKYASKSQIYGVPKQALMIDKDYSSDITTDPIKGTFFLVGYQNLSPTTASSMCYKITIDYYVEFNERIMETYLLNDAVAGTDNPDEADHGDEDNTNGVVGGDIGEAYNTAGGTGPVGYG